MSQVGMQNNANIVQSSEQFTGKIDLDKFKLNTETNQIEIRSNFSKVIHNIKDFFRSNDQIASRNASLIGAMKDFVYNERTEKIRALGFITENNVIPDSAKYSETQRAKLAEGNNILDTAGSIINNINRQFSLKAALTVINEKTDNVDLLNKMQNWLSEDLGQKPECSAYVKESFVEAYNVTDKDKLETQFYGDMFRNGITSLNGQTVPSSQTNEQALASIQGKVPDSVLPFMKMCCSQILTTPITCLISNDNNLESHAEKMKLDKTFQGVISSTLPTSEDFQNINTFPTSNKDGKLFINIDDKGITIHHSVSYVLKNSAVDEGTFLFTKKAELTIHVPYPVELNDKGMPNFDITHFSLK